jgi:hypothetical protein
MIGSQVPVSKPRAWPALHHACPSDGLHHQMAHPSLEADSSFAPPRAAPEGHLTPPKMSWPYAALGDEQPPVVRS